MRNKGLTFDGTVHRYFWDGAPVPNVTSILSPMSPYKGLDPAMLEIAQQKGVHVHHMIEMDLMGTLDESTLPDWMKPALQQWRLFVTDTGFIPIASELRVYHPTMRYAGTLDLLGHTREQPILIDLKRSLLGGHVIGMQLAAYLEAYINTPDCHPSFGRRTRRFALQIREDARYRIQEFTDPLDRTDFLALLAIHNRSTRYGSK